MKNVSAAKLQRLVTKFTGKKILVVGDLMLDEYIWGQVSRISPEAPIPVVHVQRENALPGGAANVANNIRALGGQAILAGVVGRDEAGDTCWLCSSARACVRTGCSGTGHAPPSPRPA